MCCHAAMSSCNHPLPSLTSSTGSETTYTSLSTKNKDKHQDQPAGKLVFTCPAANQRASLFILPPVVANSALVRQRASAKDHLAAATFSTGAALPMMIGGRSRCILNVLDEPGGEAVGLSQSQTQMSGPKNTALRAEHRKQNMVSVVRPVMASDSIKQSDISSDFKIHSRGKLEDSVIWSSFTTAATAGGHTTTGTSKSILDDMMNQEQRLGDTDRTAIDDEFMQLGKLNYHQQNEQQARQQMALMRREEAELNKFIRRQHRFFVAKLEDRKRQLRIVQTVWQRRDLKQALEKMLDLYQQGLVFSCTDNQLRGTCLNSLNSPLFVDVLGVLLLRPKLWSLEVCQLLLPTLVNDLLVSGYENYAELALKALKLVLTNFGTLIKRTLDESEQVKPIGVDLNLEDRLNRATSCYRLLLSARATLGNRHPNNLQSAKLSASSRELEQLLSTFEESGRRVV